MRRLPLIMSGTDSKRGNNGHGGNRATSRLLPSSHMNKVAGISSICWEQPASALQEEQLRAFRWTSPQMKTESVLEPPRSSILCALLNDWLKLTRN